MTKVRSVAVLLGAIAIVIASTAPAHAVTEVFHSSEKGQEAEAFFTTVSGCIETDTVVIANEGTVHTAPGAPSPQVSALVSIVQFDQCTQTFIDDQFGDATIPASAFQVRGNLAFAQLTVSVPVTDSVTNATSVVAIDLMWTATGPTMTTKDHITQHTKSNVFVLKFHGAVRDSSASGTVTEGPTTIVSGTTAVATLLQTDGFSLNVDRS